MLTMQERSHGAALATEACPSGASGLEAAQLVRSVAHALECTVAVFCTVGEAGFEVCASFGTTAPAATVPHRLLAEAAGLGVDGMLVGNDLWREPGFGPPPAGPSGVALPDAASCSGATPPEGGGAGLRFVVAVRVDAPDAACGVLVVGDPTPHAGLSPAKSYVLLTCAAQLAALRELQRLRLASRLAPAMGVPVAAGARTSNAERLRLLESVVVNANDAVLITEAEPIDLPGPRIVYCNAAFTRTTGYTEAEVLGRTPRMLQSASTSRPALDKLRRALARWRPVEVELLNRRKDGTEFWVEVSIVPVSDETGFFTHWVSVQRDVSPRKAAEVAAARARAAEAENLVLEREIRERRERETLLLHAAFHDDLTKLRNRAYFMDRLAAALAAARDGAGCAVLFLDLDRFKQVNDTMGHRAGDLLLMAVAERLGACAAPTDTVARLGGDEFAVLVEGGAEPAGLAGLARRIVAAMRRPLRLGQHEVVPSCSIGVVRAEARHVRPEEILRDADAAMYQAKRHDRGGYAFADASHAAAGAPALHLELHEALRRGEFFLEYQPVYDAASAAVTGFEALVRWNHPRRGLVPPAGFIAAAVEAGLIRDLGRWVLREAAGQMAVWRGRFPGRALRLGVNAAAVELGDPGFVADVRAALCDTGLDPGSLQIELGEDAFGLGAGRCGAAIADLRALGVLVALDDFGTGCSSLGCLDRSTIDVVKIDRAAVAAMLERPRTAAVVDAVIRLGHALGLEVVAEGIEDEAQRQALVVAGCATLQGYLLGPPLAAEQAGAVLTRQGGPSPAASMRRLGGQARPGALPLVPSGGDPAKSETLEPLP